MSVRELAVTVVDDPQRRTWAQTLVAFIQLGRPMFLGGGFILFGLGAAIAAWHGHAIDWRRYWLGQCAVTAIQWMTQYANEYFDFDTDAANQTPTQWSGGSRVLVSGRLPRYVALVASIGFAGIGVLFTLVLARTETIWIVALLIAMLVFAWEYSAPPLRLCAIGLGELDTALVVTVLVPCLGFALQAPTLAGISTLLVAIAPLALLQFAMLLAIEVPDAIGDAKTAKRTLVVRWGIRRALHIYRATTTLAYLWFPLAIALGLPLSVGVAAMIPVPLALWHLLQPIDRDDAAARERLTVFAVLLLVTTATAELVAFMPWFPLGAQSPPVG